MLHTILFRAFSATFIFLSTVGAAVADDLALVIGNRNYRNAARMSGAENVLTSGRAMRNEGFTVVSGRDLDGRQTRQALMDFVDRLDGSESLVVMLSGHFVHTDSDTWFLPVDSPKPTLASVNFDGVSLNTLFEIVGQKPGGAAVFLGTFPRPINLGAGLTAGIGDLNLPQGVFAATGRPDDIDQTLRRNFLPDGTGLADALADAPGSVTGHGFISNITSIQGPVGDGTASDEVEVLEAGYWMAMLDLDTQEAMEAYQRRYPSGAHAREARDWIADHRPLTETEQAKEDEDDLNLSRDERRKIQENLSLLGYNTRGIDGIFGRGTRTAVIRWQDDNNQAETGYLDRRQIRKLRRQADNRAEELAEEARKKQRELEEADVDYWNSSGAASGSERGLRRYLRRYPDGLYNDVARARLDEIEQERRDNADVLERQTWDDAESADTIESYERYLQHYPNGVFADDAKARLEVLKEAQGSEAIINAAKAEEASMGMNVIARVLVEKRLAALGLRPGIEDGNFDDKTRQALRKFQRARGFPITGYLTRQTLVRMIAEAGQ